MSQDVPNPNSSKIQGGNHIEDEGEVEGVDNEQVPIRQGNTSEERLASDKDVTIEESDQTTNDSDKEEDII